MKRVLFFSFWLALLLPVFVFAQADESYLRSEVVEIVAEAKKAREDGSEYIQQHLRLEIVKGERQGEIFEINNINDLDIVSANYYQIGDDVLVLYENFSGEDYYQIVDYVRSGALWWLAVLFALVMVLVGRFKGLKSIVGLLLSFAVIMKFIVPQILAGSNPLLVGIAGSFLILLFLIYITEGWTKVSHISILAIFLSLIATGVLSVIFTNSAKLTGLGTDEVMYLIGVSGQAINFQGLLLTGIIIGTLGVLDDLVISQVSLVQEIIEANPSLEQKLVYKKSMKVGITHIGAMTNTLFLAYAGAALPLLLLFSINNPPFLTAFDAVNNELIATEIVRTLIGSVGLILAAPLATILAVKFLVKK